MEAGNQGRRRTPVVENQLPLAVQRTGAFKEKFLGCPGREGVGWHSHLEIHDAVDFWSFWLSTINL